MERAKAAGAQRASATEAANHVSGTPLLIVGCRADELPAPTIQTVGPPMRASSDGHVSVTMLLLAGSSSP